MKLSFLGSLLSFLIILASLAISDYFVSRANKSDSDVFIEKLPEVIGSWRAVSAQGIEIKSREVLKLDRYVKRLYRHQDGRTVHIYVGYWKKQTGDSQAAKHSPRLCLPSNGWVTTRFEPSNLKFDNPQESPITASVLQGDIRSTRTLFYYWFFAGRKTYHQDWKALMNISLERLVTGRSDGGIVEIGTSISTNKDYPTAKADSMATLQEFSKIFWPELNKIISASRDAEK